MCVILLYLHRCLSHITPKVWPLGDLAECNLFRLENYLHKERIPNIPHALTRSLHDQSRDISYTDLHQTTHSFTIFTRLAIMAQLPDTEVSLGEC